MSIDQQSLINELKDLINSSYLNQNEKWEKFISILKKHKTVQSHLASIDDFDNMHNQLIDILMIYKVDASPTIDFSQYKQFELIMKELRRILENLIIEHYIMSERLSKTEQDLADVKSLLYESQYNRLCFSISTPLKKALVRYFHADNIRFDPLDQRLLWALRDNDPTMLASYV